MAGNVEPRDGPYERPPDKMLQVGLPNMLDRPSSPVSAEDQRDFKKARGGGEENLDFKAKDTDRDHGANGSGKAMFASMVMKDSNGFGRESYDEELSPNNVIVLDEDCIVSDSGEFPTIKFSNQVHDQIDCNMKNVIIEAGAKELYGPLTIATNRRKRPTSVPITGRNAVENPGPTSGSWFAMLQEDSTIDFMKADILAGTGVVNAHHVSPTAKDVGAAETTLMLGGSSKGTKNVAYRESNPAQRSKHVGNKVISGDVVEVVSLVPGSEVTIDPYKVGNMGFHRAVSIQERSKVGRGGVVPVRNSLMSKTVGVSLADWAQSTSDHIQADIEAIRFRSDQENTMEEDGIEGYSLHAISPSLFGAEPGLVDGNRQGGSGV
ncbi:hypothetical protein V6N11_044990 [Hibiscus sabdariffa]|uniref:Uncharacterized protein n=1 Tax=Hibiscus sabdariffa TaxID=183260 RepID=A0ABR2PUJ5_9ROSI